MIGARRGLVWRLFHTSQRVKIGLYFLLFAAQIIVYTSIFHYAYPLLEKKPISWPSSLLFVLETVTTLGYGELPCNDPHGSANAELLVGEFSTDTYVPYTDKEYALCFTCHNRDLLRYPDTSFATGFRDGERNLHYLHVNDKTKGRNCKLCHNMHGGSQPKLIAESALFGKWDLPLKFVKTETGGSCSPGCHKTYNYDRKTPGKAPEPAKPKEKETEKKKK